MQGLNHRMTPRKPDPDTWTGDVTASIDGGPPAVDAPASGGESSHEARYLDAGPLGLGGMGEVRRVYDRVLGRVVARKQLRAEIAHLSLARQRFVREARLTAQLQHPGVIPVHDFFDPGDGESAFTMKEVRGRTLAEVAAELHAASTVEGWEPADSGWTFDRMIEAFGRVCETVAYAHANGIVHRDLKPQNVMVGEYGEILVLDWGLARRLDESATEGAESELAAPGGDARLTGGGRALGTPAYMSPEQAAGRLEEVDRVSDVWSLGAVLYELLTGSPPYEGDTSEDVLQRALSEAGPRPILPSARIPAELAAITRRAMARERLERYPDAGELAAEVRAWQAGTRVSAHEYSPADLVRRFIRRHQTAIGASALTIILILSAGAYTFANMRAQRNAARASHVEISAALNIAEAQVRAGQQNLAMAALDDHNTVAAAVFAALALQANEGPEGRGVVMATTNAWMPELQSDISPSTCATLTMFHNQLAAVGDGEQPAHTDPPECRAVFADTVGLGPDRVARVRSVGTVELRVSDAILGRLLTGAEALAGLSGNDEDNSLLTLTTNHLRRWQLPPVGWNETQPFNAPVVALDVSRDGKIVAACAGSGGSVAVALDGGAVSAGVPEVGAGCSGIAIEKTGKIVAADGSGLHWLRDHILPPHAIASMTPAPDRGAAVITFRDDGSLLVLTNLADRTIVPVWTHGEYPPNGPVTLGAGAVASADPDNRILRAPVAWRSDGSSIALGNSAGVEIRGIPDGQRLGILPLAGASLRTLAWSPDGSRIAASSDDGRIDVFRNDDSARLLPGEWTTDFSLPGAPDSVLPIAFSPDGRLLATEGVQTDAHGIIAIWSLADHELLARLPSVHRRPTALQFTPDGARILVGYADGGLQVWALDDLFTPAAEVLKRTLQRSGLRLDGTRLVADPAWQPTTAASR